MSLRWLPREWPNNSTVAVVNRNNVNAPQLNVSHPPMTLAHAMPVHQRDLAGDQRT
jgi:hypothetical protein